MKPGSAYTQFADECLDLAANASGETRARLLRMAENWLQLALAADMDKLAEEIPLSPLH